MLSQRSTRSGPDQVGDSPLAAELHAVRLLVAMLMRVSISLSLVTLLASGEARETLVCPAGTASRSWNYSSGGRNEWCARRNGLKHGPSRSYYSNGQLLSSEEYFDGAIHGAASYYFNDGTVWRRDDWNEGAVASKWLNPATRSLSRDELERLGAVGGGNDVAAPVICGQNDSRAECQQTAPSPTQELRHHNGRTRARGPVSEGLRTDEWSFWYPSGTLAKRVNYSGGQLLGTCQEWYENGRPRSEGEYLSGEKVGLWRYWDPKGKTHRERYRQ
jgi:antitoxin component YwqK of YwqJK toxin-antitoxin module